MIQLAVELLSETTRDSRHESQSQVYQEQLFFEHHQYQTKQYQSHNCNGQDGYKHDDKELPEHKHYRLNHRKDTAIFNALSLFNVIIFGIALTCNRNLDEAAAFETNAFTSLNMSPQGITRHPQSKWRTQLPIHHPKWTPSKKLFISSSSLSSTSSASSASTIIATPVVDNDDSKTATFTTDEDQILSPETYNEMSILLKSEDTNKISTGVTTTNKFAFVENENNVGTEGSTGKSLLDKIYEKIGSIDEDRYVVPEYTSGELPRIFSSIRYVPTQQQQLKSRGLDSDGNVASIAATHNAGNVLGAASLIAGTTIGAGVLALPSATAAAGFLPSSSAMFVAYGYMVVSGLLIAELTLNRIGTTGKPGTGLLDLYNHSLGSSVGKVGSAAYFFMHYCTLVAYISQGGTNLNSYASGVIPDGLAPATFAAVCAIALGVADTRTVERVNNVLVGGVVVTFAAIMISAAKSADFGALVDMSNQHPEQVVNCFPILFLAFVYQNIVPTVVNQLEGDRWKIIYSILFGTAVPFIMYLAWNAVVLGNVFAAGIDPTSVDPVALLQSGALGHVDGSIVTAFSTLAILTSVIGFTYGLVEAWGDVFRIPTQEGVATYEKWKPLLFGMVFVPPVAILAALSNDPKIFYEALEYGGAFGVSTLFLILPPIMVWNQRYGKEKVPLFTKPLVPLGKIPLGSMWKAAGTLIVEQGAEKLGIFDYIQQTFNL